MSLLLSARQFAAGLQTRSCENRSCKTSRWRRWKSRRNGVMLNGHSYCGDDCFADALLKCLMELKSRIQVDGTSAYRLPLGLLLLSRGLIDQSQLTAALATQRQDPDRRIGECLESSGAVKDSDVVRALGAQHCLPVLLDYRPRIDTSVPVVLQQAARAVCFRTHPMSATLYVGFGDEVDLRLVSAIESVLNVQVEPCIAASTTVTQLFRDLEAQSDSTSVVLDGIADKDEIKRSLLSYVRQVHAQSVRVAGTRRYLWARLENTHRQFDLLYRWLDH